MAAWVYILRCADGTYYTGATTNIENRLDQHARGEGARYTAKRLPVTYLWSEELPTIHDAADAEKQIQGWSRAKKEALMRGDWSALMALSKSKAPKQDTAE